MRPPPHDELDDEIRGHMALSIKERIERGEDPEAARLAALKEFGNVTLTRDSIRAVWRPRWLNMIEALWHDIRVGLRSLRRAKGLAATVVVTLALGIGANAAIFSVVNAVVLSALPFRDAKQLVVLQERLEKVGDTTVSYLNFRDWRRMSTSFQDMACYRPQSSIIRGRSGADRVPSKWVSHGFFRTQRAEIIHIEIPMPLIVQSDASNKRRKTERRFIKNIVSPQCGNGSCQSTMLGLRNDQVTGF